jgi:serine/threonine protein kinase
VTLAAGCRLGPCEILAPLGAGGMGEVFRARDTRLDRDVAIKVLPEEFFQDKERRERFEREAKLLAALNHPNIATIHSFEEISGRYLLVQELVEGDTLAGRLAGVTGRATRYFRKSASSGTWKPPSRRALRTPPPSIVESLRKTT